MITPKFDIPCDPIKATTGKISNTFKPEDIQDGLDLLSPSGRRLWTGGRLLLNKKDDVWYGLCYIKSIVGVLEDPITYMSNPYTFKPCGRCLPCRICNDGPSAYCMNPTTADGIPLPNPKGTGYHYLTSKKWIPCGLVVSYEPLVDYDFPKVIPRHTFVRLTHNQRVYK